MDDFKLHICFKIKQTSLIVFYYDMQEIWTLCRIFKRNISQRKHTPELKQVAAKRQAVQDKSTRMNIDEFNTNQQTYINFGANLDYTNYNSSDQRNQFHVGQLNFPISQQPQLTAPPSSNLWTKPAANDVLSYDNWDELGSVIKFAGDSPNL